MKIPFLVVSAFTLWAVVLPEALAQTKLVRVDSAAPVPALKTSSSFLTRYEVREGYRQLGRSRGRFQEGEAGVYRARLGLRTEPIETGGPEVVLQFTPQASGWMGQTSTIVDYELGLHEGYLRLLAPTAASWVDVGRFEMNYGDALVIGNLGWHQTARAFEGVRAHVVLGPAWVDTFMTQVAEGRPLSDPFGAGDTYFYGIYAGLGQTLTAGLQLDAYLLGQTSPGTTGLPDDVDMPTGLSESVDSASELTLGIRAKQKLGRLDYRFEAGLQKGYRPNWPSEVVYAPEAITRSSTKSLAYQADGSFGVTPRPGLRVSLGGLVASGDDPATARNEGWNQLYPTAHKFLGLADVFGGRDNVASANAELSFRAARKLILKAQGHALWRLHSPVGVKAFTGTELDTHAIVPLGNGLKLRGMYGLFHAQSTGSFSGVAKSGQWAHYLEVELSFALK